MKKVLNYFKYISLVIGLSLLGITFLYYMIALVASIGVLITRYSLFNYLQASMNLNVPNVYCNLFFLLFSFGSLGAILTYIGSVAIPNIIKEYK